MDKDKLIKLLEFRLQEQQLKYENAKVARDHTLETLAAGRVLELIHIISMIEKGTWEMGF